MNHGKATWIVMALVVVVIRIGALFHIGAIAFLLLICPISMLLMMVLTGGMNHGDDKH